MSMRIEVLSATLADRPVVERLVQLYEYEVSAVMNQDVDTDGSYRIMDLDAIWRPGYSAFLIIVDGALAGFAFVTQQASFLEDGQTHYIDEFFVLRKYQRRGVGAHVARALFERFPGRWEVAQAQANLAAQTFWRHVIGHYTGDQYREVELDSPRWCGPVQVFESVRAG
jgi:predicted acetyltransferase